MNPQTRKYHALLVHYGDEKRTQRTIQSIQSANQGPDSTIIVNHTTKALHYPETIVVPVSRNNGFAAGVNRGLGVLLSHNVQEHDIIIVMNNDITIAQDSFQKLRKWWGEHTQEALMGVSVEESHGVVKGLGYVNLVTGRTVYQKPTQPSMRYVHGAFIAAPYQVLLRTKGLLEEYFLYWEDAALGARATKKHIPLIVHNDIRVTHHHSKEQSPDQRYYLVRNGALFLEQETPNAWRSYWYVVNRLRWVYHTIRPTSDPVVRQALTDARRGITGQRRR